MSGGRPVRLVYTPPVWASGGVSYPAGASPWSATPVRLLPLVSYFTPNAPAPAEEMNYILGVGYDQQNALATSFLGAFDFVSPIQAINWPTTVARTGGAGTERIQSAFWDTFNSRWIMLSGLTGGTTPKYINASIDGGLSYTVLSTQSPTGAGHLLAGCADPGSNKSVICPSAQTFLYVSTNGTSWATATTSSASVTCSAPVFFNGLFVVPGCESGTTTAHLTTSPDTATWTDRTAAIPASLAALQLAGTLWLTATNGTILVAVPQQQTLVSGTSATMTSTNGTTWTLGAVANANVSSGDGASGLSWNSSDNVFMLTFNGGVTTKIYTSPDGLTWTYVRTITGHAIISLASIGSVWVGYSSTGGPATEVLYSLDKGVTWAKAPLTLPVDANPPAATTYVREIVASPTQFLVHNQVASYHSLGAGSLATF
jgi:hypothetical protein